MIDRQSLSGSTGAMETHPSCIMYVSCIPLKVALAFCITKIIINASIWFQKSIQNNPSMKKTQVCSFVENRNEGRNLTSEKSQHDAQKPQQNCCIFMNSISSYKAVCISVLLVLIEYRSISCLHFKATEYGGVSMI